MYELSINLMSSRNVISNSKVITLHIVTKYGQNKNTHQDLALTYLCAYSKCLFPYTLTNLTCFQTRSFLYNLLDEK